MATGGVAQSTLQVLVKMKNEATAGIRFSWT
jgi:hypothetical protein